MFIMLTNLAKCLVPMSHRIFMYCITYPYIQFSMGQSHFFLKTNNIDNDNGWQPDSSGCLSHCPQSHNSSFKLIIPNLFLQNRTRQMKCPCFSVLDFQFSYLPPSVSLVSKPTSDTKLVVCKVGLQTITTRPRLHARLMWTETMSHVYFMHADGLRRHIQNVITSKNYCHFIQASHFHEKKYGHISIVYNGNFNI